MKKIIVIIGILFLLTGCTKIQDMSYDEIINTIATSSNQQNTYRTGYSYYLPRNMQVSDSTLYNEVIEDSNYKYYLYVDVVSYYQNVTKEYNNNEEALYSISISYDEKYGYLEINLLENDQYLVEIMYNYAKIEVIVDSGYCEEALLSAISILKSVEYNNSIIENLLGDDILNFYEEEFDIFNTTGSESNKLTVDEDYVEDEETLPDPDLIN